MLVARLSRVVLYFPQLMDSIEAKGLFLQETRLKPGEHHACEAHLRQVCMRAACMRHDAHPTPKALFWLASAPSISNPWPHNPC